MSIASAPDRLASAPDRLLSRQEAAKYLDIAAQTLAVWHSTKRHLLPVVKIGTRAKYRLSDLDRFIESRTVGTAAE